MHQYFTNIPLSLHEEYKFTKEQAHHAKNVLHMHHDRVRLVYDGNAFFADAYAKGNEFVAMVEEVDPSYRELPIEVTLAIALIRREKFELILQKAAELGVSRIVPFVSSRCVVQEKKEKKERQKERWRAILREASEQCKRNRIPEINEIVSFRDLALYKSNCNLAAYENAYGESLFITDQDFGNSVTIAIGPEGGFSPNEVEELQKNGFTSVTLGSRILRAETAAIYALSVIGEKAEQETL